MDLIVALFVSLIAGVIAGVIAGAVAMFGFSTSPFITLAIAAGIALIVFLPLMRRGAKGAKVQKANRRAKAR